MPGFDHFQDTILFARRLAAKVMNPGSLFEKTYYFSVGNSLMYKATGW